MKSCKRLPMTASLWERIAFRSVETPSGCIEWTGTASGGRGPDRYGKITVDGRRVWVHRVAYELHYGMIPADMTVDHLCRNTLCCNPDHLQAVTAAENIRRAARARYTGRCPSGHEWNEANTRITRDGGRQCRACGRERERRRRATGRAAEIAGACP